MVVIYSLDVSPPCRAILMTVKALGIDVNIKELNILEGAQLQPSFLKINPQHTVPTMDDDGLIIADSHAISIYLTEKYGKNDLLYPKDIVKRALVNRMLFFDEGTPFALLRTLVINIKNGVKDIVERNKENVADIYKLIDSFLTNRQWIAGSQVTLADIHLVSTITTLNILIPYNTETHPNIAAWIKRCENLPYYDCNLKGLDDFAKLMNKILA